MKSNSEAQKDLAYQLDKFARAAKNTALLRSKLETLRAFFWSLDSLRYCYFYPESAGVIVGIETRDDLAKVRAMHKGVWRKDDATYDEADTLKYIATVDGIEIDCRVNELPPSCHVEETIELIPATTKRVRRLVCNEPGEKDAPMGKILSVETLEEVPAF